MRASLDDAPSRHPHRPPPPLPSPSEGGGHTGGGGRQRAYRTTTSGVAFVTVAAIVAIVVGAGLDEAVKNETEGELKKGGGNNIIFDSDYLHFFLMLR